MAIEREKILDAALSVVNETGLDQFTTRRLAERLGVQQPALYWHFKSKSELLDALNETMLERYHHHRLPQPGESWDQFTIATARSFRHAMRSVRDGARINAGTRPSTRQFADAEQQLRLYVDAGFSAAEAFHISIAIARYVVGFVLEEQDERERDLSEPPAPISGDPLAEIAPFPILSEALKPLIAGGAINTDTAFEAGLTYFVDGVRQSLARAPKRKRRPKAPSPI